jgi:type IV secretion system protein VirB9
MLNLRKICSFFLLIVLAVKSFDLNATQYSKPIAINPHIRIINYSPNEIHAYTGFYNYVASILFEEGEKIITIAIGDPTAWQITPSGSRLFIKPLQDNADTNALIITDKRVYHFALDAREAGGINDKNLVFETRFAYPQITFSSPESIQTSYIPDINENSNLNFNYMVSGSENIKPIRIFDDGRFTYMEFPETNVSLPAVFDVDQNGFESTVNMRTVGKHLVIEKVGTVFTLRSDKEYVCVFNKSRSFHMTKAFKKKIFDHAKNVEKEEKKRRKRN